MEAAGELDVAAPTIDAIGAGLFDFLPSMQDL
jgi:hypothetical protein